MMQKIYKNVKLGENIKIEDFVVIGKPPYEKKEYGIKTIIGNNSLIRSHSVIYAGTKIGKNFQSGNGANIGGNCIIGDNVTVGTNSIILSHSKISNNVKIHSLVEIAEHTEIKEGTWIGPGVKTANMIHPKGFNCPDNKECEKKGAPKIGKYVRIGVNATICPFVKIGNYAIVGAGAVVTKDIPEGYVVVGNPAKVIKAIDEIKCKFDDKIKPYIR